MNYDNYYEPANMKQDNKKDENYYRRKRPIGGYIIVAVVFFLLGALCMLAVAPALLGLQQAPLSEQVPPAAETPKPELPDSIDEPAVPVLTPSPTDRTTPELDGETPVIADSANPIPEIVEQISPGVVGVANYAFDTQYKTEYINSTGSGFIISSTGYIVTNAHIIDGAVNVGVFLADGTEIGAELIGVDKTYDLAVLRIVHDDLTVLKIGDSDKVRVGEFAIAIGDPTGRELAGTTTFGIVSALAREVNIDGTTNTYIQTDAAINPGNSGGPLLNMAGEVIGITTAKTVTASYDEYGNAISAEGLGFALPISEAMDIVKQLIEVGYVRRPGIGVTVSTIDDIAAQEYSIPEGILVISVVKDGPSHVGGLIMDDVILECNGTKMTENTDLVNIIKASNIGDVLHLLVWRDGTQINIDITIGDLNSIGSENVEGTSKYVE